MNPHPVHALDPVFQFLDDLIRDPGDVLFAVACYPAIPLCAWILFGGSRRKSSAQESHAPRIIVIHQPAERTPPEETFDPLRLGNLIGPIMMTGIGIERTVRTLRRKF